MVADIDVQVCWTIREPIPHAYAGPYEVTFDDGKERFLQREIIFVPIPFFLVRVVVLKKVTV